MFQGQFLELLAETLGAPPGLANCLPKWPQILDDTHLPDSYLSYEDPRAPQSSAPDNNEREKGPKSHPTSRARNKRQTAMERAVLSAFNAQKYLFALEEGKFVLTERGGIPILWAPVAGGAPLWILELSPFFSGPLRIHSLPHLAGLRPDVWGFFSLFPPPSSRVKSPPAVWIRHRRNRNIEYSGSYSFLFRLPAAESPRTSIGNHLLALFGWSRGRSGSTPLPIITQQSGFFRYAPTSPSSLLHSQAPLAPKPTLVTYTCRQHPV